MYGWYSRVVYDEVQIIMVQVRDYASHTLSMCTFYVKECPNKRAKSSAKNHPEEKHSKENFF